MQSRSSLGESFRMDLRDVVAPAICLGLLCLLECHKSQARRASRRTSLQMDDCLNLSSHAQLLTVRHCTGRGSPARISSEELDSTHLDQRWPWTPLCRSPQNDLSLALSSFLSSFPRHPCFLSLFLWLPRCPNFALYTPLSVPLCLCLN